MPALGAAQEKGKVLKWLRAAGEKVEKGEPLLEIETDKATVEVEAPASGILGNVTASAGDEVPVGNRIALILGPGESAPVESPATPPHKASDAPQKISVSASPVAQQIAKEHGIDLAQIKPRGTRIEKADVLAYLEKTSPPPPSLVGKGARGLGLPASPKARRLAQERSLDIATITGTGPDGAVLAADVPLTTGTPITQSPSLPTVWRIMAERTTAAWTSVPHFFLLREVNASRLISLRERAHKRVSDKITYTDLLVKLTAAALRDHPRVNARWSHNTIEMGAEINIGIAVATEDGLVVPVIHRADELSLKEIAARREDLVNRAQSNKLRPEDISGGTFTISNLGMYSVDAFNAIINAPQAVILAVGRIAERVVPLNHQPAIQPMMMLSLSCDHRVVDGARGAQFLQTLAELTEEPLGLLD
jgi:pyruvate dehydrogenase E2 component (dihydrolipoamide acetyltransferase)